MNKNLSREKLEKYFNITKKALDKVKIGEEKNIDWNNKAKDFLDMAQRYFSDAKYYFEKNDWVTAFAALNYAHGWIDAGARLGFFNVDDDQLFVIE